MLNVGEEHLDRITEAFHHILNSKTPGPIKLPPSHPDDELKQVVTFANRFIVEYNAFAASLAEVSRGELALDLPKGRMGVLQSFKNLHANLRHLTWKTQQIAGGDFTQRIDFMGDFSVAFNSMTQQLHDAFERIEHQNRELLEAYEVIKREKAKSDKLLLNILPARVADDLKETGQTTPQSFDEVTVFFSDIVGFTKLSSQLDPTLLIEELNDIFTAFDNIIEANACERIKTIGDAYLAVCGMPVPNPAHVENIVRAALQMVTYLEARNQESQRQWHVRAGVHTGSVVGGVVGVRKYIYDVFGDTVNTASRMESASEPMRVNVSAATYEAVRDKFDFVEREAQEVSGKGRIRMYFATGVKHV